jgi:hypothetical protein
MKKFNETEPSSFSYSGKKFKEKDLDTMDPDKRDEVLDSIQFRQQLGGKWFLKLIIIPDDMFGKIKVKWVRARPLITELLAVETYMLGDRVVSVRNQVIPLRYEVEGLKDEFKRHYYLDMKNKTVESDFVSIIDFEKNFKK